MGDPVPRLVLIVAGANKWPRSTSLHGELRLVVMLVELWVRSRVLGLGLWAVVSARSVLRFWGAGQSIGAGLVGPLALVTALLLAPWLFLRWRFRVDRVRQVRAMEAVFASERVTAAQWAEAKRLIRRTEPDFFRCGNAGHLDDWAAGV